MRRAVIVDDERLVRRELRALLGAHPEIAVVGEAETLRAAEELVRASDADVVFLDIQLAGESGLDLLPRLDPGVAVVFVTAYDQYAVRAFELNALDYLLKPVSPARLGAAVRRVVERGGEPPAGAGRGEPLAYDDFLFLRVGERMRFVKLRALAAVTADAQHTTLWLADGTTVQLRRPLAEWEARLPPSEFVRIHRSALVNLDHVERIDDWSHHSFLVHVRGCRTPLRMSRRYVAALRDRLG